MDLDSLDIIQKLTRGQMTTNKKDYVTNVDLNMDDLESIVSIIDLLCSVDCGKRKRLRQEVKAAISALENIYDIAISVNGNLQEAK